MAKRVEIPRAEDSASVGRRSVPLQPLASTQPHPRGGGGNLMNNSGPANDNGGFEYPPRPDPQAERNRIRDVGEGNLRNGFAPSQAQLHNYAAATTATAAASMPADLAALQETARAERHRHQLLMHHINFLNQQQQHQLGNPGIPTGAHYLPPPPPGHLRMQGNAVPKMAVAVPIHFAGRSEQDKQYFIHQIAMSLSEQRVELPHPSPQQQNPVSLPPHPSPLQKNEVSLAQQPSQQHETLMVNSGDFHARNNMYVGAPLFIHGFAPNSEMGLPLPPPQPPMPQNPTFRIDNRIDQQPTRTLHVPHDHSGAIGHLGIDGGQLKLPHAPKQPIPQNASVRLSQLVGGGVLGRHRLSSSSSALTDDILGDNATISDGASDFSRRNALPNYPLVQPMKKCPHPIPGTRKDGTMGTHKTAGNSIHSKPKLKAKKRVKGKLKREVRRPVTEKKDGFAKHSEVRRHIAEEKVGFAHPFKQSRPIAEGKVGFSHRAVEANERRLYPIVHSPPTEGMYKSEKRPELGKQSVESEEETFARSLLKREDLAKIIRPPTEVKPEPEKQPKPKVKPESEKQPKLSKKRVVESEEETFPRSLLKREDLAKTIRPPTEVKPESEKQPKLSKKRAVESEEEATPPSLSEREDKMNSEGVGAAEGGIEYKKQPKLGKKRSVGRPPKGHTSTCRSPSKKAAAPMDQPVVFHCTKCNRDFSYGCAQTAPACFGNHVKACGVEKCAKEAKTQPSLIIKETRLRARRKKENIYVEKASSISSSEKLVKPKKPTPKQKNAKKRQLNGEKRKTFTPSETDVVSQVTAKGKRKACSAKTAISHPDCEMSSKGEQTPVKKKAGRPRKRKKEKREEPSPSATNEIDGTMCPVIVEESVADSKLCKVEYSSQTIQAQSSYPYAPMGQLWLDESLRCSKYRRKNPNLDGGGTLIGRRWVWDEGYFVDDHLDPQTRRRNQKIEFSLIKGGCSCRSNHSSTLVNTKKIDTNKKPDNGRARRSGRAGASYSSTVAEQLANGQLDPHTLVSCEEYEMGPELRFVKNIQTESVQPFLVRVNPDANFLADLHAHLCNSEIIGLLGGYYSNEEKCIYIQAAFPCRSTDRADSGHTDVEMDPVGQIYATEAIANHGMSVVGWYHSHPDFQPNPSITDIDNQASYQQLFRGDNVAKKDSVESNNHAESAIPFVGLIVGTYDGKNPTSQSVMRWFHVRPKDTAESQSVNFPMNLKTTNRHFRKMTFDKCTADNIRPSMTQRGTDIRRLLESRHLSCPISGVHDSETKNSINVSATRQNKQMTNASEQSVTTEVGVLKSDEVEGDGVTHNKDRTDERGAKDGCRLPMVETGKSPLLLSESLFDQTVESKQMWRFQSARPLYFTEYEQSILEMKHETVSDDIFAGIIWLAIEREQQMLPKSDAKEYSMISPAIPASSRSILELLLRQSSTSSSALHMKLYGIIHCLEVTGSTTVNERLDDNDAAIFHNVDVVLGHYAPKSNRINPFTSWNGASDKGKISMDCNGPSPDPWVVFYLTNIRKMKLEQTDEGQVYRGGIKMKRGHKIASCLLRWARNMQLGSVKNESDNRADFPFNNSHCNGLHFDHEQKLLEESKAARAISPQHNQYIYFVSEVMRLMAARWREHGARASSVREGSPKRRGRPLKSVSSSGSNLAVDDDGSTTCPKCSRINAATKARCFTCRSWKGGKRKKRFTWGN
ncbi:hypothetical protein ACHAXR_009552 [Thalassiosira sp. AJA248-18]